MPEPDAIVVGGGHNGLVAAWYLANAGLAVQVLERRPFVGGACITEELWPGISAPTCSYICHLLQRRVIDDLRLREHGLHIYAQDPRVFYPFPDGRHFVAWSDDEQTASEIGRFSADDARAYLRFQSFRKRAAGLLAPYFLSAPPTLADLVARAQANAEEALLERLLVGSVADLLDEYFTSPHVKTALTRAWDAGDPEAHGSLFSVAYLWIDLLQADEDFGIVRGGMGGITQAMARAAMAAGVTIRTDAEVDHVRVEDGRVRGVVLRDGETLAARLVVSNADPKRTFLRLLGRQALPERFEQGIRRLQTRAAYLKFHAALRALPDVSRYLGADFDQRILAYTHICPSQEAYRQSWLDAQAGRPSRTPVMDVQIPTVYDPTLAPPNRHVMSIWVQYAPVTPASGSWEELRAGTGQQLIDTLATYAPNLPDAIDAWMLLTPADIEQRVGMTDGNIRHTDMVLGQMLGSRSSYGTPIGGLYLCGAGTHPGGEVTGAPGHNAAHAILADLARAS
ncbi:MAG: NAD(P)/FAD-dependent oxidoreductase [Chloroflexi bacterium]|nr:NAD(P)/FAD-dependent oxidoreductase [Chloroflexota bacterium]